MKVLFIGGDKGAQKVNIQYFKARGNKVFTAETLEEGKAVLDKGRMDCVVADAILPDGDGDGLCAYLKERVSMMPVILLSDRFREGQCIKSFLAGADDYMVKPYSMRELELRIMARVKPYHQKKSIKQVITAYPLKIDLGAQTVTFHGMELDLAEMEFQVLVYLVNNPNKVCSQKEIYEQVWRQLDLGDYHTVQVHVGRIRKKIEQISPGDSSIHTVWGRGYKFVPCGDALF